MHHRQRSRRGSIGLHLQVRPPLLDLTRRSPTYHSVLAPLQQVQPELELGESDGQATETHSSSTRPVNILLVLVVSFKALKRLTPPWLLPLQQPLTPSPRPLHRLQATLIPHPTSQRRRHRSQPRLNLSRQRSMEPTSTKSFISQS